MNQDKRDFLLDFDVDKWLECQKPFHVFDELANLQGKKYKNQTIENIESLKEWEQIMKSFDENYEMEELKHIGIKTEKEVEYENKLRTTEIMMTTGADILNRTDFLIFELLVDCDSEKEVFYNRLKDNIRPKNAIIQTMQQNIIENFKQRNWKILKINQFAELPIWQGAKNSLFFTMSQIRFYQFLESQKDNAQSVKMIELPVTPSVIEIKELAIAPVEPIEQTVTPSVLKTKKVKIAPVELNWKKHAIRNRALEWIKKGKDNDKATILYLLFIALNKNELIKNTWSEIANFLKANYPLIEGEISSIMYQLKHPKTSKENKNKISEIILELQNIDNQLITNKK